MPVHFWRLTEKCVCVCERERERERETNTQADRHTRQTKWEVCWRWSTPSHPVRFPPSERWETTRPSFRLSFTTQWNLWLVFIERKRRGEATSRRAACDSASMLGVPALVVRCCVFVLQSVLVSLIAVERPLHLHSLLSIWCLFIYLTGTSVSLYKASSI